MATGTGTINATSYVSDQFEQSVNEALVEVGEKFGLYSELAEMGPSTMEQVAKRTRIGISQIGHWLREQAAAGYLYYDRATARFSSWCEIGSN